MKSVVGGLVVGLVNNKANSSTPPGGWSVYGGKTWGYLVGLVNNKANNSTPPGVWSIGGG